MATAEDRYKADEILKQMDQRAGWLQQKSLEHREKLKQLHHEYDKKKREANFKERMAANRDANAIFTADNLRDASELKSEAVDLQHKMQDVTREFHKLEEDTKFEIRQMQHEADQLKLK